MMSQRTTTTAVQTLLGANFGPLPDGTNPDLQPYVDTGSMVTDNVVNVAAGRGWTLTASNLELIERWLSAHFYTKMDPLYASKSEGGASGSFVSGKEAERYKQGAIDVDPSGSVNILLNRLFAGGDWLGKTAAEALSYDDRN